MAAFLDFIAYFEGLANDYVGNAPNNKTFYKKGLEEFLSGLTTDGNYPSMLLERYDFKYTDNGFDRISKSRTVGLIVFSHVGDTGDYDGIDIAYDECEQIIDKIYNRINYDRRSSGCPDFLRAADMNSFDAVPIMNAADGNYGWFVTFDIESNHNTEL